MERGFPERNKCRRVDWRGLFGQYGRKELRARKGGGEGQGGYQWLLDSIISDHCTVCVFSHQRVLRSNHRLQHFMLCKILYMFINSLSTRLMACLLSWFALNKNALETKS